MVVCLETVTGSQAGQKIKVWQGVRVGRTEGEMLVDDPKISSLHAKFDLDDRGGLVLIDLDSANGLRINGHRVKRIAMLLGVRFQIGKTTFRVAEILPDEQPPQDRQKEIRLSWKKTLTTEMPKLKTQNRENVARIEAFRPALQLDFLEGVQLEQNLILGYGPRRFGSDVLDVELVEPLCPPLAFEILCENGEAIFKTEFPKLVLLNNYPVREAPLKEGDLIRIGQTLIKVGFVA